MYPRRRFARPRTVLLAGACLALAAGPAAAQVGVPPVDVPGTPVTGLPLDGAEPPASAAAPPVSSQGATPGRAGTDLVGTFKIKAGSCKDAGVTSGSWFRMVNPNGTPDAGPYTNNSNSVCGDNTWTPLTPGTDGGLTTTGFQAHPAEPFSGVGDAVASRIITPVSFTGSKFSVATQQTDPQTQKKVGVPVVSADGSKLSGDLRAWSAAWNRQHFNQGAPKPDGSTPGQTKSVTGTYNASSGAYTLEWSSQIQGGPFNNFTGVWHLEGTFEPAATSGSGSGSTSSTAPGTTGSTGSGAGNQVAASGSGRAGNGTLPTTGGIVSMLGFAAYGVSLLGPWARRRGLLA